MTCSKITQPAVLVNYIREKDGTDLSGVIKCFFTLYFESFKNYTLDFCKNMSYTNYKEEELALDAFNDGLLSFCLFLKENGFAYQGATVKTVFFTFCINKLKGLVTNLRRQSERRDGRDPEIVIERISETTGDNWEANNDYEEEWEEKKLLLVRSFKMLGERCKKLILWRKIYHLGNEEIAENLDIGAGSVNNEVYKCFLKLKKLVEGLDEK